MILRYYANSVIPETHKDRQSVTLSSVSPSVRLKRPDTNADAAHRAPFIDKCFVNNTFIKKCIERVGYCTFLGFGTAIYLFKTTLQAEYKICSISDSNILF